MRSFRDYLKRHFEPIRWRDEKIKALDTRLAREREAGSALRKRVRKLESALAETQMSQSKADDPSDPQPSFRREILSLRTLVRNSGKEDPSSTTILRQIPHKLRNYSIAMSHGIRTPQILAVWPDADSIDLSDLPENFVLKSDGGAGGRGVFPLMRVERDTFRVIGHSQNLTQNDLKSALRASPRRTRPPFFAEEFLLSRDYAGPIPQDVKIYAFYGEIGQILLRSVSAHGSHDAIKYRFIWPDGTDLGDVSYDTDAPAIDSTVPIPSDLDDMLATARHLSLGIGTPFIRVDVYDTPDGTVLGELTRAPGGQHKYRPAHDHQMGAMWLRARTRYERDLMAGRPPGPLYGDQPVVDYYRELDLTESGPGSWPQVIVPCARWCDRDIPIVQPRA